MGIPHLFYLGFFKCNRWPLEGKSVEALQSFDASKSSLEHYIIQLILNNQLNIQYIKGFWGNVEKWMLEIEEQMRSTLRDLVKQSLADV